MLLKKVFSGHIDILGESADRLDILSEDFEELVKGLYIPG
jgi:hypothetical protein